VIRIPALEDDEKCIKIASYVKGSAEFGINKQSFNNTTILNAFQKLYPRCMG
jgi:hypothetical protein